MVAEPSRSRRVRPSDLLRIGSRDGRVGEPDQYSEADLEAMLRHQLQAPLQFDLSLISQSDIIPDRPRTFGELLEAPSPPRRLLDLVKRFAKGSLSARTPLLPVPIAWVLYFCSIAAARTAGLAPISRLGNAELRRGLRWCRDQPWLRDPLRERIEAWVQDPRLADPPPGDRTSGPNADP